MIPKEKKGETFPDSACFDRSENPLIFFHHQWFFFRGKQTDLAQRKHKKDGIMNKKIKSRNIKRK